MKSEQREPELKVEVVNDAEAKQWFEEQMAEQHYIGASRDVGDFMRQVVKLDGRAVALLAWGPACYALKDRDRWIGWSADRRLARLKLVVQNRRFLVLHGKGQEPNLASRCMGAALRCLPQQWMERFGYEPVLAETFTDPEAYEGTCYKASNWQPVGTTAGYSRHRADFYVPNGRPKKLWLKELCRDAKKKLTGTTLAPEHAEACVQTPSGTLPIPDRDLFSLREALGQVPDPRARNSRFRIGSILSIVAMAILVGQREIAEIARFATKASQSQRKLLGFPKRKGTKAFYEVPCYSVFYQLLNKLDPEVFATALNAWLQAREGTLPRALAMDGKMIREHIGIFSMAKHGDGAPHSIAVYDQKENTKRCEQTVGCQLIQSLPSLDGAIVTADPLHCQKKTAEAIVAKGGDYLFQLKKNQASLFDQATRINALEGTPFLTMSS